jgi:hypothetical protein
MFARRSARATAVAVAALVCGFGSLALADTAYAAGPANGSTISNAAQAQIPFSAGTYDSGQLINVVVPANTAFAPSQKVFILECAAPGGVVPTTINSCDGNTGYSSGTLLANLDGSLNVINDSPAGAAYPVYALPDLTSLGEPSNGAPRCGLGSANQCVLYIGQGGGSDTGLSAPHFFSQPFQVHPDATDSGVLNPGSGTFGADVAPGAISTINHATFTKGTSGSFSIAATGNGPPAFTKTGALPTGMMLKTIYSGLTSSGVLSGTPTQSGTFPIVITADNGVGTATTQAFTLTVQAAPTITSVNHYTFTQGTPPSFSVTATGSPAPTFSDPGSLDGLSLNATTGSLTGAPTTTGVFTSIITASNGVGSPATQAFTLTVNPSGTAPTITSASSTSLTAGLAGTFTVTASGTPAPTFIDPGPLDGLTLDATTGVLSGTPTAAGTFTSTITASNGVASPATQSFTLTVNVPPFGISTSTDLPSAAPGATDPVTFTLVGATVGAKIKFKGAGFPKGLKVSSAGVLGGVISSKVHSGTVYHPMVTVTETVTTRVGKVKTKTLTVVAKAFNLTVS